MRRYVQCLGRRLPVRRSFFAMLKMKSTYAMQHNFQQERSSSPFSSFIPFAHPLSWRSAAGSSRTPSSRSAPFARRQPLAWYKHTKGSKKLQQGCLSNIIRLKAILFALWSEWVVSTGKRLSAGLTFGSTHFESYEPMTDHLGRQTVAR